MSKKTQSQSGGKMNVYSGHGEDLMYSWKPIWMRWGIYHDDRSSLLCLSSTVTHFADKLRVSVLFCPCTLPLTARQRQENSSFQYLYPNL